MQRSGQLISPAGLAAITFVIYAAGILSGVYQASLWSQVTYLWDQGWTISNWHVSLSNDPIDQLRAESVRPDAHRLRYFLVYPIFWISAQLKISADSLFTSLVPVLSAVTVWSTASIVMTRSTRPLASTAVLALLPLILIFTAMNGRLIYAYCGFALLLACHMTAARQATYMIALGSAVALFLTSVSSGTFFSAFTAHVVLTICATMQARGALAQIKRLIPLLFVLLLYHADLTAALTKNLTYYGGGMTGLVGMVGHGFGKFFLDLSLTPLILAALLIGSILGVGVLYWAWRRQYDRPLSAVLLTSIAMGAFGYSTLSLALIPACALIGVVATNYWSSD